MTGLIFEEQTKLELQHICYTLLNYAGQVYYYLNNTPSGKTLSFFCSRTFSRNSRKTITPPQKPTYSSYATKLPFRLGTFQRWKVAREELMLCPKTLYYKAIAILKNTPTMPRDKEFINPDTIEYRKGVGVMVLNDAQKVWVGQRYDADQLGPDTWQMPQGGIDDTESPWEAALRELKEEIGTSHVHLIAESQNWITYDFPPHLQKKLWGGRFFGQIQKWFLVRFLGSDADINIRTPHPEFMDWRWVTPADLPSLIVSFKHMLYLKVLDEFKDYLSIR